MGLWNKIKKAATPKGDEMAVKTNNGMNTPGTTAQDAPAGDTSPASESIPSFDTIPQPKKGITPIIDATIDADNPEAGGEGPTKPGKRNMFSSLFPGLNERQKQMVTIVGSLVLFALVALGLVMFSDSWKQKSKDRVDSVNEKAMNVKKAGKMTLLSERVERDLWVAAEGQNIRSIQQSTEAMQQEMKALREEIETQKKVQKETQLATDEKMKEAMKKAKERGSIPIPPPPGAGRAKGGAYTPNGSQKIAGLPDPGSGPAGASMGIIRVVSDDQAVKGKNQKGDMGGYREPGRKAKEDEWISTGSFFKAVLLNGIDAPTSGGAQAEPYPVLMSIVDLTTMPNRFSVDMRECFLVGAGYGNIADERAYIRTERLSCIRKNGQAVDFELTGHVIGEDGKLGMRGRLVSKQGQQIVMALFAGTLSGFSTAMKPTGTVKLDLGTSETTSTTNVATRNEAGDVLASAGLGGAGTALDSVAKYYLKMAEKMFPVIEIDAGRAIEVVVLKGRSMKDERNVSKTQGETHEKKNQEYKAKQQES